jgi:hypothetical protein
MLNKTKQVHVSCGVEILPCYIGIDVHSRYSVVWLKINSAFRSGSDGEQCITPIMVQLYTK